MTAAVEIDEVSKRYWKLHERSTLLRSILPFARRDREELWAVRDVSVSVGQGQTIGIIGHNGAGKTSLLRMVAGVSRPTKGTIRVRGRVAPLIGVGVGFHQELTGRENVLLNGTLLGLGNADLRARFDDIVAFAELESFIDTPVKFYSSGMFMRLGFSVAVHVRPEVLVVDEVLAVGDVAFQLRCFERMRDLQADGTTILIVSHSIFAIQMLCPRTLVMNRGEVAFDGETGDAVAVHHALLAANRRHRDASADESIAEILDETIESQDGAPITAAWAGDALRYRADVQFNQPVEDPVVSFEVWLPSGLMAYARKAVLGRATGTYRAGDIARLSVPFIANLAPGTYRVVTTVTTSDDRLELGRSLDAVILQVRAAEGTGGVADLRADIELNDSMVSDWPSLRLDARGEAPPASTA